MATKFESFVINHTIPGIVKQIPLVALSSGNLIRDFIRRIPGNPPRGKPH
jgi:hypothetical protein